MQQILVRLMSHVEFSCFSRHSLDTRRCTPRDPLQPAENIDWEKRHTIGCLEKLQRLYCGLLHRELPYLAWTYSENGAFMEKRARCIVVRVVYIVHMETPCVRLFMPWDGT